MGKLGVMALTCVAGVLIGIGWTITKIQMGVVWMIQAYKVGQDVARGGGVDGHS